MRLLVMRWPPWYFTRVRHQLTTDICSGTVPQLLPNRLSFFTHCFSISVKMRLLALVAFVLFTTIVTATEDIDSKHLQCLVCRSAIEEVENVLAKIDPKQDIEIGNYRLDAKGNVIRKKVPLAQSEVHISDVLDNICEKMSDYVRATYKSNGKLTILNLMTSSGTLNPEMSKVDIIQDEDLNKSLKFYCEEIIDEHEETIIKVFRKGERDVINKICTEGTQICDESIPSDEEDTEEEEYDYLDKTEL